VEGLTVVRAETGERGAQVGNVLIARDVNGDRLGAAYLYPFYEADLEPEHPHNVYLHLQPECKADAREAVKDALLGRALERAGEIRREAQQPKTRVYACFFKHKREEIAYFLQRGFAHDEGMLILAWHGPAELPPVELPDGVTIERWRMEADSHRVRFIDAHRQVFPRHPYTMTTLQQTMSRPGWDNFTAWSDAEIAGNIMVYIMHDEAGSPVGCIEDLFVQRQWRRRGVARALLSAALRRFQDQEIYHVQLEMWSANQSAFHLYRAFGFTPVGETEIALGRYV
jgi:ribosomal protein S18 acetylase RimI-like enzyme